MDKKQLLKVKAMLKKRTPKFIRQDAHKHKRVGTKWRAAKGLHSKMRDSRRGYRLKLKGGYQSPKELRGHDKHGLLPILVSTPSQLIPLDSKVNSIIIAAGVGGRKKIIILDACAQKKLVVLNAVAGTAEKMKSAWSTQTAEKKEQEKEKEAKKKKLEEKAEAAQKKKASDDAHEHGEHDHSVHDHKEEKPLEEHAHKHKEEKEDKKADDKKAEDKPAKKKPKAE